MLVRSLRPAPQRPLQAACAQRLPGGHDSLGRGLGASWNLGVRRAGPGEHRGPGIWGREPGPGSEYLSPHAQPRRCAVHLVDTAQHSPGEPQLGQGAPALTSCSPCGLAAPQHALPPERPRLCWAIPSGTSRRMSLAHPGRPKGPVGGALGLHAQVTQAHTGTDATRGSFPEGGVAGLRKTFCAPAWPCRSPVR